MKEQYTIDSTRYEQQKQLVADLREQLGSLAAMLDGKLSADEAQTLSALLQTHANLQLLQDETLLAAHAEDPSFAQAKRYAEELVLTLKRQREQQRRLEMTSQQLIRAEKLATVGQVAATVAHELGNIITPMLMYAKLIYQTTKDDNSEVAEYAAQISRTAERAADMMRQLVDASRNEPERMRPTNVIQVVEDSLALLKPRIERSCVTIGKNYQPSMPPISGRADQLEQVFINMIINALDAMPDGGTFTVEAAAADDLIIIGLKDTGTGIPAENIEQLFEPFFTTKAEGAGTGLGLFVSHLIVNQHNGIIEVESAPNQGTTFIIKLPVASSLQEAE